MKITMTMQEVAKYAGMAVEINENNKMTIADCMKDVFKLAGNPEKYGFTEIGIDDDMNLYFEIKPEATCKIIEIITKYVKATLPLYKAMMETIGGLQKDLQELVDLFEDKEQHNNNFKEVKHPVNVDTTEDFSEVPTSSKAKKYNVSTVDFSDEEPIKFKAWYSGEDVDLESLEDSVVIDACLKGFSYARVNLNLSKDSKVVQIEDFRLEDYVKSEAKNKDFVAKLFNKVTSSLEEKGYTVTLNKQLAKELSESGIILLA